MADTDPLPTSSMVDLPTPPQLSPICEYRAPEQNRRMAEMPELAIANVIVPNPNFNPDASQLSAAVIRSSSENTNAASVGGQQSANESVIILSDDEDDDEIVCVRTVPKRRRINRPRRPPPVLDIPDSPPPMRLPTLMRLPPVPEPPKLPPEPVGKVRKCPVCLDTYDDVSYPSTMSWKLTMIVAD